MEGPKPPSPAPGAGPARFPVDTAFDTALFALIAMCLILGPALAGAGYGLGPEADAGARRFYELGLVLSFAIALPALVLYNLTAGAWVVDPGPPSGLAWRRRLGPLALPGPRLAALDLDSVAVGGLASRVARGQRTETEWSYQAFLATRDGRLLAAGPVRKGDLAAADADARAVAGALGVPARAGTRERGVRMAPAPSGGWQAATAQEGTDTGWAEILAVLATMVGFILFIVWFGTR